jgi:hypothetical protein
LNDEIYKKFNKKMTEKQAKLIWVNPLSIIPGLRGQDNFIKIKLK